MNNPSEDLQTDEIPMTMNAGAPDESGFISFLQMIAANADRDPQGIAFSEADRSLNWQTLHERVVQVGRALAASRVAPGDKVAVLGFPSLPYVECLFGAIAARACVVPLPVSASAETLEAMLTDCDAKLLFLDPDAGAPAAQMAARFAAGEGIDVVRFAEGGADGGADGGAYADWRALDRGDALLPTAQPGDAFNIIYSSGTTGMPKGIVHLHGMRRRQAQRNGFGFSPDSRTLLSTPMYSNTTITPMIGSLANGGECILMRKFDTARFLFIAAARRVTHTMLVPVQYKRLLASPAFDNSDLSAFTLSQSTGAPMDVALKQEILARWPGRFMEVYGMTEGGVSCFLNARANPGKLGTVGTPVHGTVVFLVDDAGRKLPPGAGIGEVVGRSPFMMAGYHNRPAETAEIRWYDAEGRMHHRTGDIGRFDEQGFLTLLDRRKDVIISGGNNIYAADLEAVLARHTDVQDCAVIGVPSVDWGETPLALVVARPGARLNAQALRDWVNAQVGKTQRLSSVETRDGLPRNHLGKLSKKELRAAYWTKGGAA
jgi:long-chain acyl-CoA synthetase